MADGLGQLSPELLHLIEKAFYYNSHDLPVPQLYMRLALVNKHFHQFFMSDTVWRQLDVHEVKRDISRHYLDKKQQMRAHEIEICGGFDFDKWLHPTLTLEQFNRLSLYTRAFIISSRHRHAKPPYECLKGTQTDVELLMYACRALSGLVYATADLKTDRDFLWEVCGKGVSTMFYASEALKGDKDLVLKSLNGNTDALYRCANDLKNDRQVVLAAIERWNKGFEWASETLRNDLEVATLAVSKDPSQLEFCSEDLQNNFDLVMLAVQSDGNAVQFASPDLKADWKIASAAIMSNPLAFEYVDKKHQLAFIKGGIREIHKKPRLE